MNPGQPWISMLWCAVFYRYQAVISSMNVLLQPYGIFSSKTWLIVLNFAPRNALKPDGNVVVRKDCRVC